MKISSIRENIENIVKFPVIDITMEEILIEEAINQQYVITSASPLVLKEIYALAQNSILIKSSSFDEIPFSKFTKEEQEGLLTLLDYTDYTIRESTPSLIKSNIKVVQISIKHDINSFQYVSLELLKDKEIFSYLIKNNYPFSLNALRYLPLSYLMDDEIFTFYLNTYFKVEKDSKDSVIIKNIFNKLLHHQINLKDFESIFRVFIEQEWNNLRIEQQNRYKNVLGSLCSELNQDEPIENILSKSLYIKEMKEALKEDYLIFEQEVRSYHRYFKDQNKELLIQARNKIAKFVNKYLAIIKEGYIKEKLETYLFWMRPYFTINKKGLVVHKIKEKLKIKKLKERYEAKDKDVMDLIHRLEENIDREIDKDTVKSVIEEFIYSRKSSVTSLAFYQEYLTYLKVQKIIRRLNQNYILYDSIEIEKYHPFIYYNQNEKCYSYVGKTYSKTEEALFKKYEKIEIYNKKVRKELMKFIENWDVDLEKEEELISNLEEFIPFNDQNYEFNLSLFLNHFTFQDLIDVGFLSMMRVDYLKQEDMRLLLEKILVDQGLILFLMISKDKVSIDLATMLEEHEFSHEKIVNTIKHLENIVFLAKKINVNPTTFKSIYYFQKIAQVATSRELFILTDEVLQKLCTRLEFTKKNEKSIVKEAVDLACLMRFKNKSSVPYIQGTYENYVYQMYDALDINILTSGIDTNSCFKIDGDDHDFLHYCALNQNGFVLKFTINGDLIARVSGFRNGNAIYFNQLKTIYDYNGLGYTNKNPLEKENLISAMYHVSRELIQKSNQNMLEKDKIDYCFITKSFIFQDIKDNVSEEIKGKISDYPMDHESKNWLQFVEVTPNLKESTKKNYFTTDYDSYPLICLASSTNMPPKTIDDIKKKDVDAMYVRSRSKIQVYYGLNDMLSFKLNQLKAIFSYLNKKPFEEINLPSDVKVVTGDNWYIAYTNQVIDSCILSMDKDALLEYHSTLNELEKCQNFKVYQNRR